MEIEKELCYKVNVEVFVNLVMIVLEIGVIYIIYLIDFVFNGMIINYLYNESIGYIEEDEVYLLLVYVKVKYEGELLVL